MSEHCIVCGCRMQLTGCPNCLTEEEEIELIETVAFNKAITLFLAECEKEIDERISMIPEEGYVGKTLYKDLKISIQQIAARLKGE